MKPNYYAIIPATVRYDKDLSSNAKLLYGEITALANARGYCWCTNEYFCSLYGSSERTIQRLLKQLQDKKYIKIDIVDNFKRKIFVNDTPDKNDGGGVTKMSPPYDKNVTHNNTSNNTQEYINKQDEIFTYDWLE